MNLGIINNNITIKNNLINNVINNNYDTLKNNNFNNTNKNIFINNNTIKNAYDNNMNNNINNNIINNTIRNNVIDEDEGENVNENNSTLSNRNFKETNNQYDKYDKYNNTEKNTFKQSKMNSVKSNFTFKNDNNNIFENTNKLNNNMNNLNSNENYVTFKNTKANINNNNNFNDNNSNTSNRNNFDFTFNPQQIEINNNYLKSNSIEKELDLNTKMLLSQSIEKENNNYNNEEKAKEIYMKLNQDNNKNSSMRKLNDFRGTFGIDPGPNNNLNNINYNETQSNKIVNNSINSNFTFGKNLNLNSNSNNMLNNSQKKNTFGVDSLIKNINIGALNYYSKYENNDESNKNIENSNENFKKRKNENNDNENEENQMEQSMQSVSKLVNPSSKDNLLSTWKKKSLNGNESIQEDIEKENENEKEFEGNTFNSNNIAYNNNYKNNDYNTTIKNSQIKQSLAKQELLMTFGEGGNILTSESFKIRNNNETVKRNVFDKNKTSKLMETHEEKYQNEDENEENEEKEEYNKNYNENNMDNDEGKNKSRKTKDFLDFDNFCDIPNSNNNTLKYTMRKNDNNNNEHLESEGICNIFSDTTNNRNFDMTQKVNEALKDAKDSSDEEDQNVGKDTDKQINNRLNFFGETLGKGLKENKYKGNNSKDINIKNEDMNMIISGEVLDMDVFKSGQSNRHLNLFNDKKMEDNNKDKDKKLNNHLEESEELKDSYCDTLLKNMEKYRNINNDFNNTKKNKI